MQNKNYDHYSYAMKLDAKFKQSNLKLQHYTTRCDQVVRYFITGYAIVFLLLY